MRKEAMNGYIKEGQSYTRVEVVGVKIGDDFDGSSKIYLVRGEHGLYETESVFIEPESYQSEETS